MNEYSSNNQNTKGIVAFNERMEKAYNDNYFIKKKRIEKL